jgi:hydrogenase expression/formation protein HypE
MGKLAIEELRSMLKCIQKDSRVLIPPMIGYDAGVHQIGDLYVVVSTDPCTGVPEDWFGWLLINYPASDVALSGAKPEFATITLLGPKLTEPEVFKRLMNQTCQAAKELGIAIVRGHTGTYDSLKDLLGVCTVYGTVKPNKLITSGGAKAGDLIVCTKPLGLEAIINFSITHKENAEKLFGPKKQQILSTKVKMQSCVQEALELTKVEGVHSLHDATEGGFVAALNELAEASRLGFWINWKKLPIPTEALALKKHFGLSDEQMLAMSSTGTILAAIEPRVKKVVEEKLTKFGLSLSVIGEFTESQKRSLVKGKNELAFPSQADDPYTMILATS